MNMTEWLKVMLDEIARKRTEGEQALAEEQQRAEGEAARPPASGGARG